MSIRHLDSMFDPRSVAVVGASDRAGSLGATVWRHLRQGGFEGTLMAVNRRHQVLDGQPVCARVVDLPGAPDLALICTPPGSVAHLVDELGERGTRAAVVLTEGGDAKQRRALLTASKRHLLRLLGPGSLGLVLPHLGLNASSLPSAAQAGSLAFVSQSGALLSSMLDWAQGRGIGFSHAVSLGGHLDVDTGDLLDYLASDPRTRAILLCIDSVEAPRKFMSAARAAARNKPVLVLKTGRTAPAPATADAVFDAAIQRAGMLRVGSLQALFTAVETLAHLRRSAAAVDRLTLLCNGRGPGLLAVDAAAWAGVALAEPSAATQQALATLRAPDSPPGNPVQLPHGASVPHIVQAARALLADASNGTLLLMHAPSATVPGHELAAALLPVAAEAPQRLLSCWLGGPAAAEARRLFHEAGIPGYETPEEAVQAFAMLQTYRRNQALLLEAPPSPSDPGSPAFDLARVRQAVGQALAAGRDLLDDTETGALLGACGLRRADPPGDAAGPALPGAVSQPGTPSPTMALSTHIDPLFGPVILLGACGSTAEQAAPLAVALPPLNVPLAQALIARARAAAWPAGPPALPADGSAPLVPLLVTVSQLLTEVPEITGLDLQPLQVDAGGLVVRAARVRVDPSAPGGAARFAIRPYPAELSETVDWHARTLTLRPIRPGDEDQHLAFLTQLEPGDVRLRVFYSRRSIERSELARLTQIDYEREMAFIATAPLPGGGEETLGVVRSTTDPDNVDAEFGIIVRSNLKGGGLGGLLMHKLIAYHRQRGTRRLVATVLNDNPRMLALAQDLGFELDEQQPDPASRAIHLAL